MTPFNVSEFSFPHRGGIYRALHVRVVPTEVERIVPPAGEDSAFDVQHYKHRVEITVSPTGRSVQVYVDGKRVL